MDRPTARPARGRLGSREAWVPWLAVLLAVTVTLPALTGGFVWDDRWLFQQSPLRERPELLPKIVFSGHGWGTMERAEEGSAYFRPLSNLLHGLTLITFGAHPLPFRLLTTLLHAGCALMLARLLQSRHPRAAWGAVLYAVHPVLADAHGWISAAPDLLAAGFLFATIWCLDRDEPKRLAAAACWLLALLSKESAIAGVVWIPCFVYLLPKKSGRLDRRAWSGLAVATAAYVVIRALGPGFRRPLGEFASGVQSGGAAVVGRLFLANLERLFLPLRLTLNAPSWVITPGFNGLSLAGLLAAALLATAATRTILRPVASASSRALAFGVILCGAGLLPVSQIVPTNDIFGGRFLCIPVAGLCIGAGLALAAVPRRPPRWAIAAGIVLICGFGVRSAVRAAEWRNDETLFGNEYRRQPAGTSAGFGWAGFLVNAGRIDEARPIVSELQRQAPENFNVRYLHGLVLLNDGKVAEAEAVFRDLADHVRSTPTLLANIASCQLRQGHLEEGLATLDRAAENLTLPPGMRNNRANALKLLGRLPEARREFEKAIADDPDYEPARVNLISLLVLDLPDPSVARREANEYLRRFATSPRAGMVRALIDTLEVRSARASPR